MMPDRACPGLLVHLNLARGFRGGERQTELLIRELAPLGWRQRLVARNHQPLAARCADIPGLEIVTVGSLPGAVQACRGSVLVHAHEGRIVQAAWLNRLLRGTPYVITRRVQQGPGHGRLNRSIYGRAAGLVALSASIGSSLHALDPSLRFRLIPSAHSDPDPDPAEAMRLRTGFGGEFVVGQVGALVDAHKGQRTLIEVARQLVRARPEIRFVFVGSGRDEDALRRAAAGLDNVVFTGQVTEVTNHLAAFDLFAFPSRHEGLGSVLLDALACGVPVVASDVGGIPDIIRDGYNGRLVPPGDVPALRDAILALAADPDLRGRLSTAGRESAGNYSPRRMAEHYAALYAEVLRLAAGGSTGEHAT